MAQVEKLGQEPHCSWERPDELHVRFGSRPSLLLGTPVFLKPEAFKDLIPLERRGDPLGARAVAAQGVGDLGVAVVAVLDAPLEATACGAIRFSAERSTGGAGRALGGAVEFLKTWAELLRCVACELEAGWRHWRPI